METQNGIASLSRKMGSSASPHGKTATDSNLFDKTGRVPRREA
jgi:hypothetical protein